jgi:chemotaxis protein histidine kinase CheA
MSTVSPRRLRIDPNAVARAEAALAAMAVNFDEWLRIEITRMEGAMSAVQSQGRNEGNMEALYHRAHDLKGLGATYGFPIISQIAGTLCRLIDSADRRMSAPMSLVAVHVEAIKAAARNGIRTDDDPVGKALVLELEGTVAAFDPEG